MRLARIFTALLIIAFGSFSFAADVTLTPADKDESALNDWESLISDDLHALKKKDRNDIKEIRTVKRESNKLIKAKEEGKTTPEETMISNTKEKPMTPKDFAADHDPRSTSSGTSAVSASPPTTESSDTPKIP
jgi:hypothetical protein